MPGKIRLLAGSAVAAVLVAGAGSVVAVSASKDTFHPHHPAPRSAVAAVATTNAAAGQARQIAALRAALRTETAKVSAAEQHAIRADIARAKAVALARVHARAHREVLVALKTSRAHARQQTQHARQQTQRAREQTRRARQLAAHQAARSTQRLTRTHVTVATTSSDPKAHPGSHRHHHRWLGHHGHRGHHRHHRAD